MPVDNSRTIEYTDPRTVDGDAYQAAGFAVDQLEYTLREVVWMIADARIMVRNASMQRDLEAGRDPDPVGWEQTSEAKILDDLSRDLLSDGHLRNLRLLAKAAKWNPKTPLNG